MQYDGVELELRTALEPWNVMAEEGTPGGTVRYVDSSVERLEVKVTRPDPGPPPACWSMAAPLPLRATAQGEAVAGVRFKAWQPPHGLHPTIPAHAPLIIEIWDGWRKRSPGRLHLSCRPSRRAQFRDFPGQRL